MFKTHLPALLLLAFIFYLNFCARMIFSPLMPAIEAELGIGHQAAGGLFFWLAAGYFAALTASGWLASRIVHRNIIFLSALFVGAALVAACFSRSIWELRAALVAVGAAAGFYLPSGIATLTDWVDRSHWGKAIAVHELAPNLALFSAPLWAALFTGCSNWRTGLLFIAGGTFIAGAGFRTLIRGGNFRGEAVHCDHLRHLFKNSAFWIMTVLFGVGIAGTVGIYTMIPLYLVTSQGMSPAAANMVFAFSRLATVGTAFLGGWAADRCGPRRTLTAVLGFSGALTCLMGILHGSALIAVIFLQPLSAVCFFPAGFALLASIGAPESRNLVVSLAIPCAFLIGAGGVPAVIGAMGGAGRFGAGFILTGVLILSGVLLVQRLGASSTSESGF